MTDSNTYTPRYTVKAHRTPLPRKATRDSLPQPPCLSSSYDIRAENEDDDGYDPYSDYQPKTELFEDDPWG